MRGALSLGIRQSEGEGDLTPPSLAEVSESLPPLPLMPSWRVAYAERQYYMYVLYADAHLTSLHQLPLLNAGLYSVENYLNLSDTGCSQGAIWNCVKVHPPLSCASTNSKI
jgi:hypothetical protein